MNKATKLTITVLLVLTAPVWVIPAAFVVCFYAFGSLIYDALWGE